VRCGDLKSLLTSATPLGKGFAEAPLTWNQTGPQGRPGADGMLGRHVATRTETQSVTGKSRRRTAARLPRRSRAARQPARGWSDGKP
jgi:hypothetical protein